MENQYNPEKPDKMATMAQPKKYTCPMHPHIKQDKPGTCPICGMTLVLTENAVSNQVTSNHMHGNR